METLSGTLLAEILQFFHLGLLILCENEVGETFDFELCLYFRLLI